jgi:hypothetical protein
MKRRSFLQTVVAAPLVAAPVAAAAPAPQPSAAPQRPADEAAKVEYTHTEVVAEPAPRFFNAQQFAALKKLSEIIMPPMNGAPGALEAQVPEFLDFLIGSSPTERQQLYMIGLDRLNAQAKKEFNKSFAEVDATQANKLLAPLRQPWTYDPPADPLARFLVAAKQDVRTATMNSREYSNAGTASGGRRAGGVGQYLYSMD